MRWAVLLALSGCSVVQPAPPLPPPADAMRLLRAKDRGTSRAGRYCATQGNPPEWSVKLQLAREATERERAACADRHAALVGGGFGTHQQVR